MPEASEIWKKMAEWDYEVSTHGNVRRASLQRSLTPHKTPKGYRAVCLSKPGSQQTWRVHRLVLETFVGPCPEGCEGSHLNGVRSDNRLENLCWESHKENMARRAGHGNQKCGIDQTGAKLTESDVRRIRELRAEGMTYRKIAERYPVTRFAISDVCRRLNWRHVA